MRQQIIHHMCVLSGAPLNNFLVVALSRDTTQLRCRYQLFRTKKPVVSPEWQQKLPLFVRRLEEVLYRNAKSKVRALLSQLTMQWTRWGTGC